jgi:hypothetical protein
MRRKRSLRAKLKRVVDVIYETILPGAYASTVPMRATDTSSARLHIEILASGQWRADLTTTRDPITRRQGLQASRFAGRGDSDTRNMHLNPVGPHCEIPGQRFEIALNVIEFDADGVEFALTAHHRDTGIISFASFGRLPRGVSDRDATLGWCEAKARVKRRSMFFP